MAKLTLNDLTNITGQETSAIAAINANNTALEAALENTLSRDGTSPNGMNADLDMNANDILNVGTLEVETEITVGGVSINAVNIEWQGAWLTSTAYAVNDIVSNNGSSYICLVAHTSGTFATDLAALKWELVAQKGDTGATGATGAAGTNGTNGVIQSIVAGTGVDVDATDPANPIVHVDVTEIFTATVTEINYTDGVTSSIQTQLDGKQPLDSDLTTIAGLADPNADRILFWDDSAGSYAYLTAGTGLTIAGTTISSSGSIGGTTGSTDNALLRADGTGGATIQTSAIVVDDSGHITSFGGNIKFPATQVASADANTLDDYEEGTWTPTVSATGGTITTVGTVDGQYTKIGRQVTITAETNITDNGTGSGGLVIGGVPFSISNAYPVGVGKETNLTAKLLTVTRASATTLLLQASDGTYPGGTGSQQRFAYTFFV